MNRENEALWIAVYAASCADTEGLPNEKLGDVAEARANDAVLRFAKRFADHIRTDPTHEHVEPAHVEQKRSVPPQRHAHS